MMKASGLHGGLWRCRFTESEWLLSSAANDGIQPKADGEFVCAVTTNEAASLFHWWSQGPDD